MFSNPAQGRVKPDGTVPRIERDRSSTTSAPGAWSMISSARPRHLAVRSGGIFAERASINTVSSCNSSKRRSGPDVDTRVEMVSKITATLSQSQAAMNALPRRHNKSRANARSRESQGRNTKQQIIHHTRKKNLRRFQDSEPVVALALSPRKEASPKAFPSSTGHSANSMTPRLKTCIPLGSSAIGGSAVVSLLLSNSCSSHSSIF
mmetsp:Transcript_17917/g.38524  ORF Transcript_17917/g.38524 Transcript_17917/m.38524 type:complete len:206 (+) Transcript_17917:1262-1879(+)